MAEYDLFGSKESDDRRHLKRRINSGIIYQDLQNEVLRLLPWELGVGEVPVLGRLVVNRIHQAQFLRDGSRSHVEVFIHNLFQLRISHLACPVRIDKDTQWLRNTNRIGQLDHASLCETGMSDRLRNPSCHVCSRAVNLCTVSF